MKKQFLIIAGVFFAGVGAIPTYQHLTTPLVVPVPVFTPNEKPILVSAEEIAAAVRADAFLVSSRSKATAVAVVKSGVDISSDTPTDGWGAWLRQWWNYHTTRDRLTAEVSGEVLAGFDLKQITAANVVKNTDDEVVFNLGTPEFMGVLNDEMATKTIKRETGWFRLKDETLLLAAQALGEPALQSSACHDGALRTAGESGTEVVRRINNYLRLRGSRRSVQVIFTPRSC
ncbi:MAG: DUF4230 domain-containing protein [Patescibacteria group bacterium]